VVAPLPSRGEPGELRDGDGLGRRPGGFYVRVAKPLLDRVGAAVALVVLAPLIGVVALAVRVTLGRPVLYRQQRVGLGGRPFDVYKFRTMRHDRRRRQVPVTHERRTNHKRSDDPRHTRVGRLLREWSLDELPQLWNVLQGEMSLVGPRPELVELVERYEPWQHRRHAVKPGLTGLWQVSARGDGPMQLHCDLDIAYVESVSLRTDLGLLARTIPALLARRGY
jgi:lipopolysaccharide/colanic/teichoic acid biosynthesis glycosyltransferase